MKTSSLAEPVYQWAPWANLLLPGAGLILLGATGAGILTGLVFAACANFAVLAVLLFPDDFGERLQFLAIGLAAGCYVGAQLRYHRAVRSLRIRQASALRRHLLRQTEQWLEAGQPARALDCIRQLADLATTDLLVAYRLAQTLTAAGDVPAARAAWQQVRRLDRHGIYRAQVCQQQRILERQSR